MLNSLVLLILLFIPLYPKFPLVGVSGTFVAIRLEDIILAIVYLVWGIWAVKHKAWKEFTIVHWAIILYWAIGLMSVFSGVFWTRTATLNLSLLHWFRRIEYMGMFFVGFSALQKVNQLSGIIRVLILTAVIVAFFGLGQQFLGWPVVSTNNSEFSKGMALSLGPGARINSTFAGHYDLAAFSLFPLIIIWGLLIYKAKNKITLISVGVLSYWAMLLSASRVTFAALLFSLGLLTILLKKPLWLTLIGIIGIIGMWSSPQLIGRYKELIENKFNLSLVQVAQAAVDDVVPDALKPAAVAEDRSLNIRLQVSWPRALRSFYQNPFWGTGLSSVGLASDNDYLRNLAETGLIGLISLGLPMWIISKSMLKSALKLEWDLPKIFLAGMFCAFVGLLINAVFIDVFEASKIAIVTWTLLGISYKLTKIT
jgi:hypothetical protein